MSNTKDKRWIRLGDLPDSLFCNSRVIKLNEYEFISAPQCHKAQFPNAISRYNVSTNKWDKLIKSPKDIEIHSHNLAIKIDYI